jgi:hypothetical protein
VNGSRDFDAWSAQGPVDYHADGTDILFRTAAGTKLSDLIANEHVAFEVDMRNREESWSVAIVGRARVLTESVEIAIADRALLPGRIPVSAYVCEKIRPTSLHGRRFVHTLFARKMGAN